MTDQLTARPAIDPPILNQAPLLLNCAAPERAHDFTGAGRRVWIIEADWLLVEDGQERCVSVLWDMAGRVYCTCPNGLRRIGCDHVLAVGEQSAQQHQHRTYHDQPAAGGGKRAARERVSARGGYSR